MTTTDTISSEYIRSLRRVASTVVMVTSYVGRRPWGLTVSAFCSVAASPPLCLVSINTRTATYASIAESGMFGVSILSSRHLETARYGSAPGLPKFLEGFCSERTASCEEEVYLGPSGSGSWTPEVPGAVAHYHCSVDSNRTVADHAIVIGRVRDVMTGPDSEATPLLYWEGAFHELGDRIGERFDTPSPSMVSGAAGQSS